MFILKKRVLIRTVKIRVKHCFVKNAFKLDFMKYSPKMALLQLSFYEGRAK